MTINPIEKFVLLALADHANDEGECWPSQATIADATGYSERRVKMAVAWLRENKFLTVEKNKKNKNTYRLSVGNVVHGNDVPVGNTVPLYGERGAPLVGNVVPLVGERGAPPYIDEPTNEPPIEPPMNHHSFGSPQAATDKKPKPKPEHETDPLGESNTAFCEFYKSYPRKKNRRDAFRAFLKLKDADRDLLLVKTREAAAGMFSVRQKEHVPYPASWINSLDWKDKDADLSAPPQIHNGFVKHGNHAPVSQGFDMDILGSEWGKDGES